MSRIRLQWWATNRRGTEYTVNLDGMPLGCDGLFSDPALVIIVGQAVAKVPHRLRDDGAMVFDAFGGSGSTAQAARELGRSAISIELDESWCRKQAGRLKQGSLF